MDDHFLDFFSDFGEMTTNPPDVICFDSELTIQKDSMCDFDSTCNFNSDSYFADSRGYDDFSTPVSLDALLDDQMPCLLDDEDALNTLKAFEGQYTDLQDSIIKNNDLDVSQSQICTNMNCNETENFDKQPKENVTNEESRAHEELMTALDKIYAEAMIDINPTLGVNGNRSNNWGINSSLMEDIGPLTLEDVDEFIKTQEAPLNSIGNTYIEKPPNEKDKICDKAPETCVISSDKENINLNQLKPVLDLPSKLPCGAGKVKCNRRKSQHTKFTYINTQSEINSNTKNRLKSSETMSSADSEETNPIDTFSDVTFYSFRRSKRKTPHTKFMYDIGTGNSAHSLPILCSFKYKPYIIVRRDTLLHLFDTASVPERTNTDSVPGSTNTDSMPESTTATAITKSKSNKEIKRRAQVFDDYEALAKRPRRKISIFQRSACTYQSKHSTFIISMNMVDPVKFKRLQLSANGLWDVTENAAQSSALVMDKAMRSYKFLMAMARGIPIVRSEWLQEVNEAESVKDVRLNDYLFKDEAFEKKYCFSLAMSLQKARENGRIFKGLEFMMTANVLPQPAELQEIIKCAGGKILERPPDQLSENQKMYLVSTTLDRKKWNIYKRANKKIIIISPEAIMLSVMRQTCAPLSSNRLP